MKKARYIYLIMVLLLSIDARAQYVWESEGLLSKKDLTSQNAGELLRISGTRMTIYGGVLIVGGAALIGWSYNRTYGQITEPLDEISSMAYGMVFIILASVGISAVSVGIPLVMVGVPTIIAGNDIIKNGGSWELTLDKQHGFGLILEGGVLNSRTSSCLQARIVPGYHINQNIFMGLGVAPSIGLSMGTEESTTSLFSLPVFADVRASFTNAIVSPYIGVGAGIETVSKPDLYLSAEAGVRYRRSQDKTRSFWLSGMVEYSTSYLRPGVKMGYSF